MCRLLTELVSGQVRAQLCLSTVCLANQNICMWKVGRYFPFSSQNGRCLAGTDGGTQHYDGTLIDAFVLFTQFYICSIDSYCRRQCKWQDMVALKRFSLLHRGSELLKNFNHLYIKEPFDCVLMFHQTTVAGEWNEHCNELHDQDKSFGAIKPQYTI